MGVRQLGRGRRGGEKREQQNELKKLLLAASEKEWIVEAKNRKKPFAPPLPPQSRNVSSTPTAKEAAQNRNDKVVIGEEEDSDGRPFIFGSSSKVMLLSIIGLMMREKNCRPPILVTFLWIGKNNIKGDSLHYQYKIKKGKLQSAELAHPKMWKTSRKCLSLREGHHRKISIKIYISIVHA